MALTQPYVVNETAQKVFSEGFTDINKTFPITSSADPQFWGTYGDGYYYMERKVAAPRAVLASFKGTSKNFSLKAKVQLGPTRDDESTVGVMYLVQTGGKGGFVFEINRKKSFRIQDLGTGAFITKEGDNGWLKSSSIEPMTRNNTIEIKSFRGQFDIYINNSYVYSYVNKVYDGGKHGAYIGKNASAKLYYFNLYEIDIPGAEPEVDIPALLAEVEQLKTINDSLKTIAIQSKYAGNNKGMAMAIKVLEDRVKAVNDENIHLKKILADYEAEEKTFTQPITSDSNSVTEITVSKISKLSIERDSLSTLIAQLRSNSDCQQKLDSLKTVNDDLNNKMVYIEKHMAEVQSEIDRINNAANTETKTPSTPSAPAEFPKITSPEVPASQPTEVKPSQSQTKTEAPLEIAAGSELMKKDSTYEVTIDVDDETTELEITEGMNLIDDNTSDSTSTLVPLNEQKIKVKQAVKAEFKD